EHYPLVLTTILLYLYLSLRYLKDCSHPILPSITLGIALSLHLISILLFPSLIYQYIVRLKFRSLRFWLYSFLPLVIYFSILSLILFFGNKPLNEVLREYHLLPLFSSQKEEYSIFSVPHIIDLFNLYLLIGPLGLIMLFWGMVFFFKKSDINNPVVIFLAVAFVSFFIYSFIFNPDKGWARDWDLFTFVGLLSTIFGGYLFCRFEDSKKFGYLTVVIIATVLLHTIPWVIINRSQSMSLKRFQQLMAVNPEKSGSAHEELAIYFRDQKLYHQAEQEHLAAIKVLPYNGRYWAQLGYLYTLMNEPTKATYAYQQSLAVDPENHREHINLGNVYRSVGEYRLALLHYQKALEIDSTLWPAYFNKGLVFTDIGYIDSAIAAYEKGLRFNKQNFDIYFNLGTLYATQKEYGLAIKNLKQATMLKANDPQVHYNLGLALFGNQCYQAAIDEYKVVIKLKPDFAEAFNNLGLAYEKIGDTLQAENCYRSALRINPKLSQPWYNLQRLKR
ncbi:MAG: tetratricopeptide repeat protein, partial [candidate division WOR-3 bacterium]